MALKILIGCDPEVFVKDNNTGKLISAHGLVPGDKQNPFTVLNGAGAVQVDGMALEFNTAPAGSVDTFVARVKEVQAHLAGMIPKHCMIVDDPVAVFDPEYFQGVPDEAKALGCNPDWNAWTGGMNPTPDNATTMRTASGHVHIGWTQDVNPFDEDHMQDCMALVRQLDYYVGLYSLTWDKDDRRRKMYGQAGAFRPKPYGVEYRVPSNAWLKSNSTISFVFNASKKALLDLLKGARLEDEFGPTAQNFINQSRYDWYNNTMEGVRITAHTGLKIPTGK